MRTSCVVAREVDGQPAFCELNVALQPVSDAMSTAWFWTTDHPPRLPDDIGAQPPGRTFPGPGGTKFGLLSMPARCDGTGMHATGSVDFEVVVSGQIVLELPSGESRVLGPGDSVVLTGVPHRWRNPFDQPCVYAAFILGAEAAAETATAAS